VACNSTTAGLIFVNRPGQILQHSLTLAPDNKNTRYQLAKAYYLQGDNNRAIVILEKITTANNSFTEKPAAVKLLKQIKAME